MIAILSNRLKDIRKVRDVWTEDSVRLSVEKLVSIRNSSVLIDILRILLLKPSLLTLDVAVVILPAVSELLFEIYEEFVVFAFNCCSYVVIG
jgi:con80 domain of Katanin